MIHARARCWIHEDCVSHPEIGVACGPNPPDMHVLHGDWGIDGHDGCSNGYGGGFGDGDNNDGGNGWGDGYGGGFGDGDGSGGALGNGSGGGDGVEGRQP